MIERFRQLIKRRRIQHVLKAASAVEITQVIAKDATSPVAEIEPDSDYRASYREVTLEELTTHWREIIREMAGADFRLGEINQEVTELRFRNIALPSTIDERLARVKEIATEGTDRTMVGKTSDAYEFESQRAGGKDPLLFMWTVGDKEFIRQVSNLETQQFIMDRINGILIFDAKTEKGVEAVTHPGSFMTMFKNPERKNEALLGIIYVTL